MIEWAVKRCGGFPFRDDATAIGTTDAGQLAGVVVFDNFSPGGCYISVASDGSRRWLNREFLIRASAYPFIQLNQRRITGLISAHNSDSIAFCKSCGFQFEGTMRQGGVFGEDLLLFGLLKEECRWLPNRMAGKHNPAGL
jgi:RimJ/RimL family protein N-acetyltransferase